MATRPSGHPTGLDYASVRAAVAAMGIRFKDVFQGLRVMKVKVLGGGGIRASPGGGKGCGSHHGGCRKTTAIGDAALKTPVAVFHKRSSKCSFTGCKLRFPCLFTKTQPQALLPCLAFSRYVLRQPPWASTRQGRTRNTKATSRVPSSHITRVTKPPIKRIEKPSSSGDWLSFKSRCDGHKVTIAWHRIYA